MTCPNCRSENEMVYSALSHGFICQEADCGLELEMNWEEAAALLDMQPEPELTFA